MSIDPSQKSCELAACYTELENKHIQLELDLKLVQENFMKAKDEEKGTIGENLMTIFILLLIIDSDLLVILHKRRRWL